MASRAFTYRLLAPLRGVTVRPTSTTFRVGRPYSTPASTPANTPPFLQKLKGDLKAAMRAKDAQRLAVLRSIITKTLNASKTDNPVYTDLQLVVLLRKTQRASLDAAKDFRAAGREDLAGREEEQAGIAQEYISASGVKVLSDEELRTLVEEVVGVFKDSGVSVNDMVSEAMKRIVGPRKKEMEAAWGKIPQMVRKIVEQ